jgi:predicted NAD/FAD-dependent oxidoreductase
MDELLERGVDVVPDWPHHLRGPGTPCQPQAYLSRTRRLALAAGLTAFPKVLSRDLELRLQTRVEAVEAADDHFEVQVEGGQALAATHLVLSCPLPQILELLGPLLDGCDELRGVRQTLRRVSLLPSLTVLAGYQRPPARDWHLHLPGPGNPIHSLINDSSKRADSQQQVLVIQGAPEFSRRALETEPGEWAGVLLLAAAEILGDWAAAPAWQQPHRWRFARVQRGDELSHPVRLRWPGGATLGLCGEAFNPAGGLEGAYLSGLELAARAAAGHASPVHCN